MLAPVHRTRAVRSGYNLTEIMIGMFILGIGMTMMAGSLPVSVRTTDRANSLSVSSMVARAVASRLIATYGRINLPCTADDSINWFSPTNDVTLPNATFLVVNDPANWGVAIPSGSDSRFAAQVFYERNSNYSPPVWDFHIVVQTQRNGRFLPPVDNSDINNQAVMSVGDLWCSSRGNWQAWNSPVSTGTFRFGVPGGVAVYNVQLRF